MGKQFTVRTCLAAYQRWFRTLYGVARFRHEIPTIERFFDAFPSKKYLRQFTVEMIDDWAIERGTSVRPATVLIELGRIKWFWRWAEEQLGYSLPSPVPKVHKRLRRKVGWVKNKTTLSLPELRVILTEINDVCLQRYIYLKLLGWPTASRLNVKRVSNNFTRAAIRVNRSYKLMDFVRSVPKLRLSILQDLGHQVGDTLALEPKCYGAPLRDIKLSRIKTMFLDKRPTVSNLDQDNLPVLGVGHLEDSPEGQTPMSDS